MIKKLAALFMCAVLLVVTGCSNGQSASVSKNTRYEVTSLELFDTVTTVVIYAKDEAEAKEQAQWIIQSLKEYHDLYDIYEEHEGVKGIKYINDNAGKPPVQTDARVTELLYFGLELYSSTSGMLNIGLGSVLDVWREYRDKGIESPETAQLPPMSELLKANTHTSLKAGSLVINRSDNTVALADESMKLDVGAIAKGFAVEKVAGAALEHGITSALISVGGNVRAIGVRGDGSQWSVGVQDPDDASKLLCTLDVADGVSVVTSGTYQRFYTVNGKTYHHIIDPNTLMPSVYYKSLTIIAGDSGYADALSTALFCLEPDKAMQAIESSDGIEAIFVLPDGTIMQSSGIAATARAANG